MMQYDEHILQASGTTSPHDFKEASLVIGEVRVDPGQPLAVHIIDPRVGYIEPMRYKING